MFAMEAFAKSNSTLTPAFSLGGRGSKALDQWEEDRILPLSPVGRGQSEGKTRVRAAWIRSVLWTCLGYI